MKTKTTTGLKVIQRTTQGNRKRYFSLLAAFTFVIGASAAWAARDIKGISEELANDLYFYPICAGIVFTGICLEGKIFKLLSVYFGFTFVWFFYNDFILHVRTLGIDVLTGGFLSCILYLLFRHRA